VTTLHPNPLLNKYLFDRTWEEYQSRIYNREYRAPHLGENELLTVFPEGKKLVKEKLLEYELKLAALNQRYQASLVRLMKNKETRDSKEKRELLAVVIWHISFMVNGKWQSFESSEQWLQKQLKRLRRLSRVGSTKDNKGTVTYNDIYNAKATPIENFLDFNNQGFARCVFHEERTGSLKLYRDTNRFKCFGGCGKSGDVIDIVMQLNKVDFINAIKFILNK